LEPVDEYTPLLPGIGFSGYRSFASWQEFLFPTKVTVLAGVNNSGKSNVLRFLQDVMPKLGAGAANQRPSRPELQDLDRPRGFENRTAFEVGVPVQLGQFGPRQDPANQHGRVNPESVESFQEGVMSLLAVDDNYWSRFELVDNQFVPASARRDAAIAAWPGWQSSHFNTALHALGGGTVNSESVMDRLLVSIGGFPSLPPVVTIASARRVEATEDDEPDWLSGRGIIRALATLQSPPHDQWELAQPRWTAINRFVQTVLGDPDASLNVPFDFSTIQVETPQRVLPLGSIGSGVEQVVVLAAAATVTTQSLVCLEEPETNLHPLMQKKLIRYLTDETDNQYVIATHSSHLLDDDRATAYHVRLTAEGSVPRLARRPHELIEICNDLGYRPSDLLQANCVLWVEGPSDRIYIRRWLELVDPTLVEGVDYSIMFYGGKLLSHLTVSEAALTDFISLRHLNRASAIVIDSDKTGSHQHISATKKRIKDEFAEADPAPGLAWVTKCYTVENYIPGEILVEAVESVHPGATLDESEQWKNPLPGDQGGTRFDKVGIASAVSSLLEAKHLDVFDLRSRVGDVCDFIRASNGNSTAPEPVDPE
jgi:energy-coupling factor transporter ATP-binding protein EcfA2